MLKIDLIPELKKIFDIQFIKDSFYSFLPTEKPYSSLLVINNKDEFFTISNADIFVVLLLQNSDDIFEKITDKLEFVFNRDKYIVSFEKSEIAKKFDEVMHLGIDDIIAHSEKNGVCENNLFNIKLKEIFGGQRDLSHILI